jgi:hypothetical protein
VTVRLWVPDAVLQQGHMRLSNDGGYSDQGWTAFQVTTTWDLSTYGSYVMPRHVYAWFRDGQGSVHGSYSDDIIYDPVAPQGQVSIVNYDGFTVTLRLDATDDNSGVADMRLGGVPTLTLVAWQPYTNTTDWVLTGHAVYAQFRDRAGNESFVYGSDGSIDDPNPKRVYLPLIMRDELPLPPASPEYP